MSEADIRSALDASYAAAREIQAQGAEGTAMTAESTQQPDLPGRLARDPDAEGTD